MSGAHEIIERARAEGRDVLTEAESKQLLAGLGIRTTQMRPAASREEAVAASREVGYPCVLKVASPDITHKSDAGGVKVGLADEDAGGRGLRRHHGLVPGGVPGRGDRGRDRPGHGASRPRGHRRHGHRPAVRPRAHVRPRRRVGGGAQGRELQARAPDERRRAGGHRRDPRRQAARRASAGSEPVDKAALEDILLRVSEFVSATPEVREMDLNPVFAYPDGAVAVDARVDPRRVTDVVPDSRTAHAHLQRRVGGTRRRQREGGQLRAALPRGPEGRRLPQDLPGQPQARGDPRHQGVPEHQRRAGRDRPRHPAHADRRGPRPRQGVRGQQGQGGRGVRLRLRRARPGGQGARARDRARRPRGRHARRRPQLHRALQPRGGRDHLPAGAHEGHPHGARLRGRLLAERLVRRLPRLVPRREGPALQHHRELRQRVRPGGRGLPRVLRRRRADAGPSSPTWRASRTAAASSRWRATSAAASRSSCGRAA